MVRIDLVCQLGHLVVVLVFAVEGGDEEAREHLLVFFDRVSGVVITRSLEPSPQPDLVIELVD